MLITVETVTNKQLKRFLEHSIYLAIVFILIPGFYYFELFIVCPAVVEAWSLSYYVHVCCAIFLLFNIVGNLIFGIFTDTSIKGRLINMASTEDWTFCAVCECLQPPRSWHCSTCNICILKRDHHCTFFACCVGYFNHRYFILFTMYIFISMVYSFYYNVKFLTLILKWNHGLVIAKFVFPLASFFIDFGEESIYVSLVVINFIIAGFSGFLFVYHMDNILKGKTVPETKKSTNDFIYDKGWKANIVEVFGSRWYLTWILPFISSPLPGNGFEWIVEDKNK